ncbi:MAG: hypothetical protein ACI9GW_002802 [Halieaceae bacterium]|jgi:hypothetical protein
MLTTKNLERLIELEDRLRSEYQVQLDAKSAEIEKCVKETQEKQTTIEKQLETLSTLSTQASANKHVEQQNRELNQRSDNLNEKISALKLQIKSLQKDLAVERSEITSLKQFDPIKMKKNLDANKKKLAEKTAANDLFQKSLSKSKTEKAELQLKIDELEAKLEQHDDTEAETETEEAAA